MARRSAARARSLAILAAAVLFLTGGVPRKAARLNRDANVAFDAKQYDEASELYDAAQAQAPDAAEISYNLGNTLYKQGKFGDAAAHLRRGTESEDPALRQRSYYNLGNALHDLQELQLAVQAYRGALKIDPGDRDAKINLEKTLRELKDNPQQQQKQNQKKQQQKKDEKNQQQQQGGQQGSQGDEQDQEAPRGEEPQQQDPQQQDPQPQEAQPGEQPQESEPSQPRPQPGEERDSQVAGLDSLPDGLSREEALRILEAMREQEKELQKQRARQVKAKSRRVDKDW